MRELGKNWIGSYLLIGDRQRYIRATYGSANCEAGRTGMHSFEITLIGRKKHGK